MTPTGKRMILGVSVSLGEHETHWRTFLQSLVDWGLRGVELIISDAHAGLKQARRAVFGGSPWQRSQFHLQQNAQAYVPRQDMKKAVAADIRDVFNAPDRDQAERLLADIVQKYSQSASRLAEWLESNIPEGLAVFAFPVTHQRRIRTTNGLERLHREIRRRSRVATLFHNEASCLRLLTAVLMEISEVGKATALTRASMMIDLLMFSGGGCRSRRGCGYVGKSQGNGVLSKYPSCSSSVAYFYRNKFALPTR